MQPETLIITGPKVNTADILSLAAIVKTLTTKTHILTNSFAKSKLNNFTLGNNAEFIEKIAPATLSIKLPKQSESIEDVQWQQTSTEVSLQLKLGVASLDPSLLKFELQGANYKNIILFGLTTVEELNSVLQTNFNILTKAKVTLFGKLLSIPNVYASYFGSEKDTSIGEQVFNYSTSNQTNAEVNELILGSIIGGTNRFKLENAWESTFNACALLVKSGAKLQAANAALDKVFSSDSKPAVPVVNSTPSASPAQPNSPAAATQGESNLQNNDTSEPNY